MLDTPGNGMLSLATAATRRRPIFSKIALSRGSTSIQAQVGFTAIPRPIYDFTFFRMLNWCPLPFLAEKSVGRSLPVTERQERNESSTFHAGDFREFRCPGTNAKSADAGKQLAVLSRDFDKHWSVHYGCRFTAKLDFWGLPNGRFGD